MLILKHKIMNTFSLQNILLILAVLLSGLVAGLLYGYGCSVNIGLGRLGDLEYLKAMQSINSAILNPVFFLSFFGTLVVLPAVTWFSYRADTSFRFYLLLSAACIYWIGVFGVTSLGNVPLNETLANFNVDRATVPELRSCREAFEPYWNNLHLIRTFASVVVFFLSILSILIRK
jgi:uncharacterized membrane protein